MLTVKFFSLIREALNCEELSIECQEGLSTVNDVREYLASSQGDTWRDTLFQPNVVHALNQRVVPAETSVCDGDEIAFFPPMTGG